MAQHADLTGLWTGRYWYPESWEPEVEFIATLTAQAGSIGGWISEPDSITYSGARLDAFIDGSASGSEIQFAKTYDGAGPLAHRVDYEGMISEDRCTIVGQWILAEFHGGFAMTRPAAIEAEAEAGLDEEVVIVETIEQ